MKLYILRWEPSFFSVCDEYDFLKAFQVLCRRNSHGVGSAWRIYKPGELEEGDWFILCRVGTSQDGIVGLGRFTSKPYLDTPWLRGMRQHSYADTNVMMLLKRIWDTPLAAEKLEKEFPKINWHGGRSGIPLNEKNAERLAITLSRYIASLPASNTEDVALRRSDGGRFTLVCGLLSNFCPALVSRVKATQTATNAMLETYMPEYNDQLTVDFSRLKTNAPIESCVRLLEWPESCPDEDVNVNFNVNDLLPSEIASQPLGKKFSWMLASEYKYENEYDGELPDYWEMPKFHARLALFTTDLKATIDFLDRDCDSKQWIAMSECFVELSAILQSVEFIQALDRCAERFPNITRIHHIDESILEAEEQLSQELYEQLHPSVYYIHVPNSKKYEEDCGWYGETASHVKNYVFVESEINSLMPLFNVFNEKFNTSIKKRGVEFLVLEKLDEAIGVSEAFRKEHSQEEAGKAAVRLLVALKRALRNGVKVIFNF